MLINTKVKTGDVERKLKYVFSPNASTLIHKAHFDAKDLEIFPFILGLACPTIEAW